MDFENDLNFSAYIKKYINKELSISDSKSFEDELEKNLILKNEYDQYLILIKESKQKNIDALTQRFKEIDAELDSELELKKIIPKTKRVFYKRYLLLLAAIALLRIRTLRAKSIKIKNKLLKNNNKRK